MKKGSSLNPIAGKKQRFQGEGNTLSYRSNRLFRLSSTDYTRRKRTGYGPKPPKPNPKRGK